VRRDKDDRQWRVGHGHATLEFGSTHARHAHVKNQTAGLKHVIRTQERFRRRKALYSQADRSDQVFKRAPVGVVKRDVATVALPPPPTGMVKFSREDLISGRVRWPDLTPAEWRDRDKCAVAEIKATGTFQPFQTQPATPNTKSSWIARETLDHFGRIDALLNIAGAVPQINLFEMTDEQWHSGLELKLHGARRVTILAWEALKVTKGSVVLISGSAALDPKPGFAAAATINAAIIALAKAFSEQGIKDGIQVNSVVPGPVMTGRRQSFMEKWAPAHGMTVEEATKKFPEEAGISRYGKSEEIADLMAFLVSPAAKWLTGTSVRMDGGEIKGL
jgi:3-oxoacyl-[acyl-carrier protein] reductase